MTMSTLDDVVPDETVKVIETLPETVEECVCASKFIAVKVLVVLPKLLQKNK